METERCVHIRQEHGHSQSTLIRLQRALHLGNVLVCKEQPPCLLKRRKCSSLLVLQEFLEKVLQLGEVMKGLIEDLRELGDSLSRKWLTRTEVLLKTGLQRVKNLADAEEFQAKVAKS